MAGIVEAWEGTGTVLANMEQEIAEEDPVAAFEKLFKYRYTEKDSEYLMCRNRRKTMYQVPVISPWPPRHKRSRGGRGYRDRHYDDWDRERYGLERSHHRPLMSRYNDYSPPRYHQPQKYHSHSPSPLSPCVPFSYEHDVKSSQEVSASQEQCQEEDEEKQEDTSCSGSQLAPVASFMDNIVMSMRESPEKLVTDSDVQALLNNASTSSSKPILPLSKKLKKEKKEPIKRQKEEEKIISPNESVSVRKKALTDGLVVSHGHPKSVTASILLDGLEANQVKPIQQKRKKRKLGPLINDNSDEEEDEIIDPVKVSSDTLQLSTRLRQGAAGGGGVEVGKDQLTMGAFYNQPEKLMVRINLRHFNKNPDTHFDREIRPLSPPPAVPPISSPSSSYMYSSAVTLDDSNKHVVLRLSKPLEPDTELLKRSHKSKKKKKSKGH